MRGSERGGRPQRLLTAKDAEIGLEIHPLAGMTVFHHPRTEHISNVFFLGGVPMLLKATVTSTMW